MVNLVENERSWWIQLISKLNGYINQKSYIIKKSSGESWLNCWWKTLFPDVFLIWWDNINNILHWWELKLPDTKITDNELINNAIIKAENLWVNSFLLWNFSIAVLYVKEWKKFVLKKTWDNLKDIKTRKEALDIVKNNSELWENMLIEIIDDLNEYFNDWTLEWKSLVDAINLNTIVDSISNFSLSFQEYLEKLSHTNLILWWEIDLWWWENKLSYQEKKDDKKLEILTKIIINNWINKIIYAQILKKHYKEALIIEDLSNVSNVNEAIEIFNSISMKCDFWNIFKNYSIQTENINVDFQIPWEILDAFKEFNSFLNDFKINELSPEIIENLLINTIFQNKRKLAWQFSTPDKLAKILVKSTIENKSLNIYDWCCWTWTIIKEAYRYKTEWLSDEDATKSIFASDKFSFPIQISNINLSVPSNKWRLLQLFKKDIFEVVEGTKFTLYDPDNWVEIERTVPTFNYILSNLPFIQQEDLKKFNPEVKNKINSKVKSDLNNKYQINGKSDIYAYILVHLHSLLDDEWKIWIIISNSWLSNVWGIDFKNILLSYFNIEKIITSWKWRWFNNAKVVTNILILKKKNNLLDINEDEKINFITINKDIDYLDDENINKISKLILLNKSNSDEISINKHSIKDIKSYEKINIWWNALFWNITFLKDIEDKLVDINQYFKINRWEKTWCDDLFYPKEWNWIDNEFIFKTIKTTSWNKTYNINPTTNTFICNRSIKELELEWKEWTINWIQRFENKKSSITKKAWKEWYNFPCNMKVDFVVNINPHKLIAFYELSNAWYIWQRWTWLKILKDDDNNKDILHCLLNSILGLFFVEAIGFWRWEWALDLNSKKIKNMKLLNPKLLSQEQKKEIINKFKVIKEREILDIDMELNQSDRIDFDKFILWCYWIQHIYDDLKQSLILLYKIRISVTK